MDVQCVIHWCLSQVMRSIPDQDKKSKCASLYLRDKSQLLIKIVSDQTSTSDFYSESQLNHDLKYMYVHQYIETHTNSCLQANCMSAFL
jgi:midasin (ATPase involved in ribosome maturation)